MYEKAQMTLRWDDKRMHFYCLVDWRDEINPFTIPESGKRTWKAKWYRPLNRWIFQDPSLVYNFIQEYHDQLFYDDDTLEKARQAKEVSH